MGIGGSYFILHDLFIEDMMPHVSSWDRLLKLMKKYTVDFKVTGGCIMETLKFLGIMMEVQQK
jgi:hypothetical protein